MRPHGFRLLDHEIDEVRAQAVRAPIQGSGQLVEVAFFGRLPVHVRHRALDHQSAPEEAQPFGAKGENEPAVVVEDAGEVGLGELLLGERVGRVPETLARGSRCSCWR